MKFDLPTAWSGRMLFRIAEVASICGISKSALYGEVRAGRLHAERTRGGEFRVERTELLRWLARDFFVNPNRDRQKPNLSPRRVQRNLDRAAAGV